MVRLRLGRIQIAGRMQLDKTPEQALQEREMSFHEIYKRHDEKNDTPKDGLINRIIELEWDMFDKVTNTGGRGSLSGR